MDEWLVIQGPQLIIAHLSFTLFETDHNEGPVPDAEEDASVPEGAQQGVCFRESFG